MKEDRIFTTKDKDGNDWVLRFKRPSQTILSKAELVYRTAFSRAFREGVLTNAEVDKTLRERGIWDDKRDVRAEEIRGEIEEFEGKLNDPTLSNEQGRSICSQISLKRMELTRHNSVYSDVSDNTCETIASEARNQFFCAECIHDNKTGLRVYKDVDDFKSRLDEASTVDSYREVIIATLEVIVGRELPSDLTTEYAENKWLSERGLDKPEEEAEAKDDEKEEEQEEEKEEKPKVEEKKPKRRTRKKTAGKKA